MRPKECIKRFLTELWNQRNSCSGEIYQPFSQNLTLNSPLGKKTGISELSSINDKWLEAFPDMQLSKIEYDVVENLIIAKWSSKATHMGDFQGMNPTGKKIAYRGETLFVFQNDKIVRYNCTIDMPCVYKQLGFYLKQEEYDQQQIVQEDKKLLIQLLMKLCPGNLSVRETECLSLYVTGFNSKQVGKLLFISPRTVETHIHRALHEVQCTSKEDCIDFMLENHYLSILQDLAKTLTREYENRKKSRSILLHR